MKYDALEELLSKLLVATSDYGDDGLPVGLQAVLAAIRKEFLMDMVFVSRFEDGARKFVCVDRAEDSPSISPGMSDPLEQSWCHSIARGRIPELIQDAKPLIASGLVPYTPLQIGTHLSVPVRLPDGEIYGTLCAFSLSVSQRVSDHEVRLLRGAAQLIGSRLSERA